MSIDIGEVLANAEHNLGNGDRDRAFGLALAKEQLHNARILLEKGYAIDDEATPLLEQYPTVEDVPGKAD